MVERHLYLQLSRDWSATGLSRNWFRRTDCEQLKKTFTKFGSKFLKSETTKRLTDILLRLRSGWETHYFNDLVLQNLQDMKFQLDLSHAAVTDFGGIPKNDILKDFVNKYLAGTIQSKDAYLNYWGMQRPLFITKLQEYLPEFRRLEASLFKRGRELKT